MDMEERLNKFETKQETFEVWAKANLERLDEQAKQYAAEQAEWRKRHDEELREYREEMRQLKIASDQRFARIDEKFDRMSAKIDNMNKYLSRMSVTSMASVIGMGLAVLYFIATH